MRLVRQRIDSQKLFLEPIFNHLVDEQAQHKWIKRQDDFRHPIAGEPTSINLFASLKSDVVRT